MSAPRSNNYRHGMSNTPTYCSWSRMFDKSSWCDVAPEFHKFDNFLRIMGVKPKGLVLSRKDFSKPHSPENSIWTTLSQANLASYKYRYNGGKRYYKRRVTVTI